MKQATLQLPTSEPGALVTLADYQAKHRAAGKAPAWLQSHKRGWKKQPSKGVK